MWRIWLVCGLLAAMAVAYLAGHQVGGQDGAATAEHAADSADVAQLQAKGDADQAVRVTHARGQADDAAAIAQAFAGQALQSEEADAPLSPDRAQRLRDSDVQLCALRPGLAGCAPAP